MVPVQPGHWVGGQQGWNGGRGWLGVSEEVWDQRRTQGHGPAQPGLWLRYVFVPWGPWELPSAPLIPQDPPDLLSSEMPSRWLPGRLRCPLCVPDACDSRVRATMNSYISLCASVSPAGLGGLTAAPPQLGTLPCDQPLESRSWVPWTQVPTAGVGGQGPPYGPVPGPCAGSLSGGRLCTPAFPESKPADT